LNAPNGSPSSARACPLESFGGRLGVDSPDNTFEALVAACCETEGEEAAFRDAWRAVTFSLGEVVCDRGEVADRIYWLETAAVRVEMTRGPTSELVSSVDLDDDFDESDLDADPTTTSGGGFLMSAPLAGGEKSGGEVGRGGDAGSSLGAEEEGLPRGGTEGADAGTTADGSPGVLEPASSGFGMTVFRNFFGAVGFYRRGGVGKVRFGRILVEREGSAYVLTEAKMAALEENHPRLAIKLHKLMAGTLANAVVSRNKLITQFVK
jgi:hypothetical protein